MVTFGRLVVSFTVGALALLATGSACSSFGTAGAPEPDATPSPAPTASDLAEAGAPDAANDAISDTSVVDANDTRPRACKGVALAKFESALPQPTLVNLSVAGAPSYGPVTGFGGFPMVAQINPMERSAEGLKGMGNASIPPGSAFCFEMWAQVSAPAADAGGEVTIVQFGLGGSQPVSIDFEAAARFGGNPRQPFLAPTSTEPHHWVVRVFPFADRHKAELTVDGHAAIAFTSPNLVGTDSTFLTIGASTVAATANLVKGAKVVVGEAYATVEPK